MWLETGLSYHNGTSSYENHPSSVSSTHIAYIVKVRSHQTRMKCYTQMIYMLTQCKDAIDNPAVLFARMRRREFSHLWRLSWKFLNFGGYSRRVNQSGACSSSDVITSGGRKSKTTMKDKVIVVVCGYPELYDTTSYFYKNRNTFCNETGAACRSPSMTRVRVCCVVNFTREWSE